MGCRLSNHHQRTDDESSSSDDEDSSHVDEQKSLKSTLPKRIDYSLSLTDTNENGTLIYKSFKSKVSTVMESKVQLTSVQKDLIKETWKHLVENISRVGVITFTRLFETHPEVQEAFLPFRELDKNDLKYSKELRSHALRVMGVVQKVVARIDDNEKCVKLLRELGRKHLKYGAKAEYVDLVGPQFIYAIKPSLEATWNQEIERAWHGLFTFMAFYIKDEMSKA